jgi:hypothetical protein
MKQIAVLHIEGLDSEGTGAVALVQEIMDKNATYPGIIRAEIYDGTIVPPTVIKVAPDHTEFRFGRRIKIVEKR